MGIEAATKQDFQETVLMRWESESSSSTPSSSMESSTLSEDSSSEISDDATSSSSSNDHAGPLFQLSDLMTQLPIKRGLSKYYEGKSQTFTSLESVLSVEDLSKATFNRTRFGRNRKMIKSCKSYAGGILDLDSSSSHKAASAAASYSPKAIISKKTNMNSTNSRHLFAAKRQYPFKPSPSINLLNLV